MRNRPLALRPRPRASGVRRTVARHVIPAAAAIVMLLPLAFMLLGSLRAPGLPPPRGIELVPATPTFESYQRLNDLVPAGTYARNSALVALVAVPLTVLVAALAGFGIRLLAPRRRRAAVIVLLVAMSIPVSAVWATRFEVFERLGVIDTLIPLMAPALIATNPFYALVFAWSFSRVDDEQLDAARLDGARSGSIWWRVALPQVRPAILAVTVLAFAFHWSNFIDALLYVHSIDRFTLPLGLRFVQQLNPTDWPLLMAGSLALTLPVVLVLLLAQRVLFEDPIRVVGGRS